MGKKMQDPMLRPHELYMAELIENIQHKALNSKEHIRKGDCTEYTLSCIVTELQNMQGLLQGAYAVRQAIIKTR